MSSTEIAKGFKKLNPGPLDEWYGPYANTAAACAAIPDTAIDGVNFRSGKVIAVNNAGKVTEYSWRNGFTDKDLHEVFSNLEPVSFEKNPGYITTDGGINTALGFNSGFIFIKNAKSVIASLNPPSPDSGLSIAFYDENKAFISGVNDSSTTQFADIPETAFYAITGGFDVTEEITLVSKFADQLQISEITERLDNNLNVYDAKIINKPGYIANGGSVTGGAPWRNIGLIYVNGASKVTANITATTDPGTARCIAFYDENGIFISGVNSGKLIETATIPLNAYYLNVCSSGDVISVKISDNSYSDKFKLKELITTYDFNDDYKTGYINVNGNIEVNEPWLNTGYIYVRGAKKISVNIDPATVGAGLSIAFYDANKTFISGVNNGSVLQAASVPGTAYFAVASGLHIYGVTILDSSYKNSAPDIEVNRNFVPPKLVMIKGGSQNVYLPGIASQSNRTGERTNFILCDKLRINKNVAVIDPAVDTDITFYFDKKPAYLIGKANLQFIDKSTFTYSSASRSVICLGDSLTGFDVWHQEFSRQLNGNGNPSGSVTGTLAPMTLPITFLGTRGGTSVKHEGRGSWSVNTYLTQSSAFGATNAFWNPSTSQFDIDYYLTQNNFYTSLGGTVNSNGFNLDIMIFLGWNDGGIKPAELTTLINLIKAKLPDVHIILVGMQSTPLNVLDYTYDTYRDVMDMIIKDNIDKNALANTLTNVHFFPTSMYFNPLGSYTEIERKATLRDVAPVKYVRDYIHPVKTDISGNLVGEQTGLGQIADIVTAQYLSYLATK